jgi:hypothetical protein
MHFKPLLKPLCMQVSPAAVVRSPAQLRRTGGRLHAAHTAAFRGKRLEYGDAKVANREIRVWHGATENGP